MRELSYLAFAAGYRRISFVFIEGGQLATWHTSCVAARDAAQASEFAKDFIDLLDPNVIVIENIEAGTRKGTKAMALIDAIRKEAEQSRSHLVAVVREKLFRTRYAEAVYLVKHYPDLADKVPQRGHAEREPHHMVLFEALALAHQAAQGGAMLLAAKM